MSNLDPIRLINRLVTRWNRFLDEWQAWLNGAADGGANSDGIFPVSDRLGNTVNVKSPARLQQDVDDTVDSAAAYKDQAEASAITCAAQAAVCSNAVAQIQALRDEVLAFRNEAELHKNGSAGSAAQALANKNTTETLKADAETAANSAPTLIKTQSTPPSGQGYVTAKDIYIKGDEITIVEGATL